MVNKELEAFRKSQREAQKQRTILGKARRGFEKEREEKVAGRRKGFRGFLEFVPRKKKAKIKEKETKEKEKKTTRRSQRGPLAAKPGDLFTEGRVGNPFVEENNPGAVQRQRNIFTKRPPSF